MSAVRKGRLLRGQPPEDLTFGGELVTSPKAPRPLPGPNPLEFCPALRPFLRVSLELPDERGRRGELFVGWRGVTGDDLAAGIAMLDAQASRRGLGKAEWRL